MGEPRRGLSRRALLASGSVGAAGVVMGAAGASAVAHEPPAADPGTRTVAFRGAHQAGIVTPPQDHGDVPAWLGPLPDFTVDRLEDRWSGGDLLLQICSDDELVVSHALRLLTKEARTFTTVRWVQRGFRGPRGRERTPRNLMGQVDGTANPRPADHDALVWRSATTTPDGPAWLDGGTTMVARRIRMELDTWDEVDRTARERTIGRRLDDGRPLTGGRLEDDPDLEALDANGLEVIDPFAHVRRARTKDRRQRILRRPYNYDDPPPPGELTDAGLVFVSFQADLEAQFVPLQRRLAELDLLNQWTTPIGSAVFAVLPGARRGEQLGQSLLT